VRLTCYRIINPVHGQTLSRWNEASAVRLDCRDPLLRLQSVTIYVRDIEQSLRSPDQLGFPLIFDARVQPGRFRNVRPPEAPRTSRCRAASPARKVQANLVSYAIPLSTKM